MTGTLDIKRIDNTTDAKVSNEETDLMMVMVAGMSAATTAAPTPVVTATTAPTPIAVPNANFTTLLFC